MLWLWFVVLKFKFSLFEIICTEHFEMIFVTILWQKLYMYHPLSVKGLYAVVIFFPYIFLCFLFSPFFDWLGVTVLVDDLLGAAVYRPVDEATAGHLHIVDVRRFHMLMGRLFCMEIGSFSFWVKCVFLSVILSNCGRPNFLIRILLYFKMKNGQVIYFLKILLFSSLSLKERIAILTFMFIML